MGGEAIELTGILGATDPQGRLRLCLVDSLAGGRRADDSWARLRRAAGGGSAPYRLPLGGAPDDAGIRGECWVAVPGGKARRARVHGLAAELRGREVALRARVRRYSFVSRAGHNFGERVAGAALDLESLEALGGPPPRPN